MIEWGTGSPSENPASQVGSAGREQPRMAQGFSGMPVTGGFRFIAQKQCVFFFFFFT